MDRNVFSQIKCRPFYVNTKRKILRLVTRLSHSAAVL